jgi:very-short-patch-repair endonuclease
MYPRPQIPNRVWENVTSLENFRREPFYRCSCGQEFEDKKGFRVHLAFSVKNEDEACRKVLIEVEQAVLSKVAAGDYVICEICGFVGKSIAFHTKREHELSRSDYERIYGPTVSAKSKNNYSVQNEKNGDWIERAKLQGRDLSDFKTRVSASVSASIMANPKERERRSLLLAELNKREDSRERASVAAKKTSARKDIQNKRAAVLKDWRDNNPEEFREKCVMSLINSPKKQVNKSKVEQILFALLSEKWEFKRNVRLYCPRVFVTNKTGTKEVDLYSESEKIIVEFDGPSHFKALYGEARLGRSVSRDLELLEYCLENKIILARLDDTTFVWRRHNSRFVDGVIETLFEILDKKEVGIYYFGGHYVEDQIGKICWRPEDTGP